ncbi:hypothetical protein Taro_046608, partial [Colocasia esculenta]|nr:hypothetical protein [Colocasia esculenta]
MYEWYDGSVYMITYTYGTYIGIRCAWFLNVLEFWPKARLASISIDVDVVSASTLWTPTLSPASSDVDANFFDLHALQSPEFWEQASSPIGELSPTELGVNALDAEIQLCVQRSCRPLLKRPETAAKFPWPREVGVAERRPVRTSRDVTSGRSSRPRHRKVLYFPHRHLWIMEYSCKTQAHTQAALQAQLEAQQTQVPAQDHGGPSTMERFKRMLPPSFKGESDPLLAESWMREIEKIFRAIRCADEDKVTLATYMLHVWFSLYACMF